MSTLMPYQPSSNNSSTSQEDVFIFPQSYAQQRLWVLDQLAPGMATYTISFSTKIWGPLNISALQQSIDAVVQRHESLRTTFAVIEEQPVQIIAARLSIPLQIVDLCNLPINERERNVQQYINQEVQRPFDLTEGPLFRVRLLQLDKAEYLLLLTIHHIIADGWSMRILFHELSVLYESFVTDQPALLPELPIQYADFTQWQRKWLPEEVFDTTLAYWKQQLHGCVPVLELPTDRPRSTLQTFNGAIYRFQFSSVLARALRNISREEQATLFMTLLTALNILLMHYSGQTDLIVGSPIANRQQVELEGVIGCFVNILALRTNLEDNPSFRDALVRVRETCQQAYIHQDMPFEQLVNALQVERDTSRSPLVQVMFDLQKADINDGLKLAGLTLQPLPIDTSVSAFDLTLSMSEVATGLSGWIEYNTDLFNSDTIARFINHLHHLLEQIAVNPDLPIEQISLLTESERQQLLAWSSNSNATSGVEDTSIHYLVEAQAKRTPDALAVVQGAQQMTYHELNQRAEQLAIYIQNQGISPGTVIGLCVERSLDLPIALLGILKAECAYLPLDPTYPHERLASVLADAQVPLLLTQSHLRAQLSEVVHSLPGGSGQTTVLCLDEEFPSSTMHAARSLSARGVNQLAYIIYTSGSTGQPKGVLITHRGLVNHSTAIARRYSLGPRDRVWQFASISFDVAAEEFFPSWIAGATVVLQTNDVLHAPSDIVGLIIEEQLSVLNLPATYWHAWVQELADKQIQVPETLRLMVVGSERVSPTALNAWKRVATSSTRWLNAYGPTESTITATLYELATTASPYFEREIPIGKPIEHVRAYILDQHMQLVPVGIPGELYLGGAGLSWGYHQRPDSTAAHFLPDPFSGEPGARLYRTGDKARYLSDGNLEFLGRLDDQIKLRGFRIELSEIEEILRQHPAVHNAVVHLREDLPGDKHLVAYIVSHTNHTPDMDELRRMMKAHLPKYMIPSALVLLDSLPLMPNGKVNRSALPIPQTESFAANTYIAPQTALERTIASIWQRVLGREHIGSHDNFFDLGGHSLLMIQVHTMLLKELQSNIALLDLFRYPSISSLAQHLHSNSPSAVSNPHHISTDEQEQTWQQKDIAVIGMAGRFPGASSIEAFWQNLKDGVESITFFSDQELLSAGIAPAVLQDTNYVKAFGMLSNIDLFDASFFNITPREAQIMNPQQRLFLECAWEAIERAGYNVESYPGRISLYAGSSSNNYMQNVLSSRSVAQFSGENITLGNEKEYLTTRTSYKLNLRGPSVNVQSACSTSLVAIHLACRSLLQGECDMALAGGIAIQMLQKEGSWYQEGGILSPDGHCRAFDAQAQGTVAGDGVGIVVLKRLDLALADGDYIHAIIKGSAINNDGSAKVGYTAPSIEGQAQVITEAQTIANVAPETIRYVEAHGTGTILGDPIEVAALTQAFSAKTSEKNFCALGSVKTNIGHLDAAAGVAGFIKTVLALKYKMLPPSMHFHTPNPRIDFANSPFYVNRALTEWVEDNGPRRAGISSFGIGGTNAHAVLEEAPLQEASRPTRSWQLLTLSARSASALETVSANLAAYLQQHTDLQLADVAYTLQVGRKAFDHRRVILCHNTDEAISLLKTPNTKQVATSTLQSTSDQPIVFLFPGQGAQYVQMAAEIYQTEKLFRDEVDHCAELLYPHLQLDLRHVLYPPPSQVEEAAVLLQQTAITQPALFVIEYALAKLLMSWGIHPTAMIGHSIGEYVAACLAGVFSLEDGLFLISQRGQLMQQCSCGSMLTIPLPEKDILPLLGTDLSLAAVNGPSLCVVAGPQDVVQQLEAQLNAQGIEAQHLYTSHAFHSQMMEPILEAFNEQVRQIQLHPPQIPYISNVTGTWITVPEVIDAQYWTRHLRATVRFTNGVHELLRQSSAILLEIGPGRTLGTIFRQYSEITEQHTVLSSLRRQHEQDSDIAFLHSNLGKLWLAGVHIDWTAFYSHEKRLRVPLPTYPFERKRYWIEPEFNSQPVPLDKRIIDDWLYIPIWKQSPPFAPYEWEAAPSKRWMILSNRCDLSTQLLDHLKRRGHEIVVVTPAEQFSVLGNDIYTIHPGQRQMYDMLLEELRTQGTLPQHIVYLWSITSRNEQLSYNSSAVIDDDDDEAYYSLIYLVQALADQGIHDPLTLSIVSNGVQRVTGEEQLYPQKAMLLGPCRVIPQEYPHITCRSIDITVPTSEGRCLEDTVGQLVVELTSSASDTIVAYRANQRWIQSFEPIQRRPPIGWSSRIREDGVYLLTGGLGGIGLELAAYLAQTVHARLVLVGRSSFPDRTTWHNWLATHTEHDSVSHKIRRIQDIERYGAQVQIYSADVADEQQMRHVLKQVYEQFGVLHGVIHAAGIAGSGIIQLQTPEKIKQVLSPKVRGTLLLASLLKDAKLDFFVLCSSLRSIIGGFGTVDYCTANNFLDAFAQCHMHSAGTLTVSINWDSWKEFGMSAEALQQAQQSGRIEGIAPTEGVELFRRILTDALSQVVVSTNELQQEIKREYILAAQRLQEQIEQKRAENSSYTRPQLNTPYVAPRSELEQTITTIWQDLLGIAPIGIYDNFFELGGDSIVSLQIAAKAKRFNLQLTPKNIFECPTIAQLSTSVGLTSTILAEQGLVTGFAPLTPTQHWFFKQQFAQPHHWNMTYLLRVPPDIDAHLLEQALQYLIVHHDALRLRFTPTDLGWQQMNTDNTSVPFTCVDLSAKTESEQCSAIESIAVELQASLSLTAGPILRVVLFHCGTQHPGRLLIIIHHLVVDIVSWRILLQDLQDIYQQLRYGQAITLPQKTTSFKQWAEYLTAYAQSDQLQQEYWLTARDVAFSSLPIDNTTGLNTEESARRIRVSLTAEETHMLLQEIPAMAHVQVNDLLLTALAQVFTQWTGDQVLWIDLENHGREPLSDEIDLSRTVGWFTNVFPVCLNLQEVHTLEGVLQTIKEQLRRIPARGIGYGLLRYLHKDEAIAAQLATLPQPQVAFLYLGQTNSRTGSALFEPIEEPYGFDHSPQELRTYLFEIAIWVKEECLQLEWSYSANMHYDTTVESLIQKYMDFLRAAMNYCRHHQVNYTSYDFPYANLSQEDLNELVTELTAIDSEQTN